MRRRSHLPGKPYRAAAMLLKFEQVDGRSAATGRSESTMSTSGAEATVRTRVRIPLRFADGFSVTADAVTFHGLADGLEHVAMVFGDITTGTPLVRPHSECLTGDVFGS